jgi:uncharacterized membrane protein YoaK (UPF0700 family)
MGCINALSTIIDGMVTNAATGNMQKVSMALFDHLFVANLEPKSRERAFATLAVLVAFIAGVGAAAAFMALKQFSFVPDVLHEWLFTPVGVVFALLLGARSHAC